MSLFDCKTHGIRLGAPHGVVRGRVAATLALLTLTASVCATTIQEAADTALNTHPQVGAAQAQRQSAKNELRQARGGYFPSVDVNAGVGREESNIKSLRSGGLDNRYLTRREFGIKLKQLVFDGFETQSSVERFGALAEAAESDLGDTREEIAFQAVGAFIEMLRHRQLTELAQQNVKDHEVAVEKVRQKVSLTGNADLHQAQARLSLARSTLASREGRLREAASRYRRVVGTLPGDLVMPERLDSQAVSNGELEPQRLSRLMEETIKDALENHPALKSAQFGVNAASANASGAKAAFFPTVNVELSADRDANLSGVKGVRNNNALMLVGSWNLFRGGSDRARERALAAQREAAKQNLADVRRGIEEQVAIAVQAKATSTARLTPLRAHVDAAERTLEAYQGQLTLGRRSLLDTLNAANELFSARSNLASGLHADLLNQYFVETSKGRLQQHLNVTSN